jgi:hypothetical protein
MKKQLICRFNTPDTIGTHFLSSFVAGFAGAVASTPIDVIRVSYDIFLLDLLIFFLFSKTRLMNQANPRFNSTATATLYKGAIDCFVKVRFVVV